ncbi:hypothetical protein BJX70DRAFT_57181 [Aspergillus crustosus]
MFPPRLAFLGAFSTPLFACVRNIGVFITFVCFETDCGGGEAFKWERTYKLPLLLRGTWISDEAWEYMVGFAYNLELGVLYIHEKYK